MLVGNAGVPQPGKTMIYDDKSQIDPERVPLNGGVLIKTLELAIDPFMRGRMRRDDIESYVVCICLLSIPVRLMHRRITTLTFVFAKPIARVQDRKTVSS